MVRIIGGPITAFEQWKVANVDWVTEKLVNKRISVEETKKYWRRTKFLVSYSSSTQNSFIVLVEK